jgi:hypothetical protein
VYIEKIDIKRMTYRPPKAMAIISPNFCTDSRQLGQQTSSRNRTLNIRRAGKAQNNANSN